VSSGICGNATTTHGVCPGLGSKSPSPDGPHRTELGLGGKRRSKDGYIVQYSRPILYGGSIVGIRTSTMRGGIVALALLLLVPAAGGANPAAPAQVDPLGTFQVQSSFGQAG